MSLKSILVFWKFIIVIIELFVADLGPFATRDPKLPLPGNMNLDIGQAQEDFQILESQQSLASVFLEAETDEIKKHQALVTFLNNTKIDERSKERQIENNQIKETCSNLKVSAYLK